ncbi:hypothetical protein CJ030_MR6G028557 [Morella rubra]|uniref:Leucine-rich repeat-containing N-terminal plant-type domain-containing protein n=1 Tax=Morella rubra TaxID=262757 RepID=A0A6A1VB12_9ROSI|nr:hypothetical protein CJ030_MR6G028557 [Morella rubra]
MGLSQLTLAPCASRSLCIQAFVFLCYFGLFITFVVGGGNETDRLALLDFKSKITHDPMGVMSSWNDSLHFCQWQGVTCGRRHQRVTRLDLHPKSGRLHITTRWKFEFPEGLYLFNNSFTDIIPPEVGRLRRLQDLQLTTTVSAAKFRAIYPVAPTLSALVLT